MTDKKKNPPHEKPISLFPLDFKEALAAALKVPPKSKEEMDKAIKDHEKKKRTRKQTKKSSD